MMDNNDLGRLPSGTGLSQAEPTVSALIPDANVAPVWRSGCGMAVEAVDRARAHFAKHHRRGGKALKAYDDLLDEVLQLVIDATRRPVTLGSYAEAFEESKAVNRIVAQAIEARRAATTGAVHESAVPQECAQSEPSS